MPPLRRKKTMGRESPCLRKSRVFDEFKDMMPLELPKRLFLRRKEDH